MSAAMDFLVEAGICGALALAGSLFMVSGQIFVEEIGFHGFDYLARRGLIHRFAPDVPYKLTTYSWRNFWAVAGSHLPLFLVMAYFRQRFIERAVLSLDPLSIWGFAWTVMVLHDAWFFWVHTVMHNSKPLYKEFHQLHHGSTSDLNAFGTSFAEAKEFLFDWSCFYGVVLTFLYFRPSWNPLAMVLTLFPVGMVNVMGHSGIDLPSWLYLPLSLGILATPGAQESKIHFIHHIDPRYNRSLYFTWWDRMVGTYKDTHRLVGRDPSKQQQFDAVKPKN